MFKIWLGSLRNVLKRCINGAQTRIRMVKNIGVIKIAIRSLRRVSIHVFLACSISLQHISFAFRTRTPEYNLSPVMRAFACLTKFSIRVLSCVDNQDLVTVVLEKSRLWIVRRRRRPAVLKRLRMRTNFLRLGCPTSIEIHQRHWILSLVSIMSKSEAVTSMINVLEELQFLVILADHHLIWELQKCGENQVQHC